MLNVYTGTDYITLEQGLVQYIKQVKDKDLFTPVLIVVPNRTVRNYLIHRITETLPGIANLTIHTFFSLAQSIYTRAVIDGQISTPLPYLDSTVIQEQIVRRVLQEHEPLFTGWLALPASPGLVSALYATVTDLIESDVDPVQLNEFITQSNQNLSSTKDDKDLHPVPLNLSLLGLLYLHYYRIQDTLPIISTTKLVRTVTELIPETKFLSPVNELIYYGFYELTGVQTDFFHKITNQYPVTLFFCTDKTVPGLAFSQQFYDRYVIGLSQRSVPVETIFTGEKNNPISPNPSLAKRELEQEDIDPDLKVTTSVLGKVLPRLFSTSATDRFQDLTSGLTILNVTGVRDELWATAKEIVNLTTTQGYKFRDCAVLVRSIEEYGPLLTEIFTEEHQIPVTTSYQDKLVRYPITKLWLRILGLRDTEFPADTVIEILNSPYTNYDFLPYKIIKPDIPKWIEIIRTLRIDRGWVQWDKRLTECLHEPDLEWTITRQDKRTKFPREQVNLLKLWLTTLKTDLVAIPDQSGWDNYVDLWVKIFNKYINFKTVPAGSSFLSFPGLTGESTSDGRIDSSRLKRDGNDIKGQLRHSLQVQNDTFPVRTEEDKVSRSILTELDNLRDLTYVSPACTRDEFNELYTRCLTSAVLEQRDTPGDVVHVLDVMSARTMWFKVVFLLGLNEKKFPRVIREDPFLRDEIRQKIGTGLGYKIPVKQDAYTEEKQLFYLSLAMGKDKVYCIYQRADEDGKMSIPSHYLQELNRIVKPTQHSEPVINIPRRVFDKINQIESVGKDLNWTTGLLTPKEVSLRIVTQNKINSDFYTTLNWDTEWLNYVINHQSGLDTQRTVTEYDGCVNELPRFNDKLRRDGISPSALEKYGTCPFQYFMAYVLKLEEEADPTVFGLLARTELGNLYHLILQKVYAQISQWQQQNPGVQITDTITDEFISQVLSTAFEIFTCTELGLYPVLWDVIKSQIENNVRQIIYEDLTGVINTGVRVYATELKLTANFTPDLVDETFRPLKFTGFADRIDFNETNKQFRVIDYKLKRSSTLSIGTTAVQGGRGLALALYIPLTAEYFKQTQNCEVRLGEAVWYILEREQMTKRGKNVYVNLDTEFWDKNRDKMKSVLNLYLTNIFNGTFFIYPQSGLNGNCQYCTYDTICRKNYYPTRYRVERSLPYRKYDEIKKQVANK